MGELIGGCFQIVFALIGGVLALAILAFGFGILAVMVVGAFPIIIVIGFIGILLIVFAL